MANDSIIHAQDLGKKYFIGHQNTPDGYSTLRDAISNTALGIGRSTLDVFQGKQLIKGSYIEEFWALKGVNFDINPGDKVGIIGPNGAGKSTLLKVLSRITEPSQGRVEIKGRVASLLEVGTGFHPELSGRENIYLNGSILGMTRSEIKDKFDEIVEFSGVEKFLDTPVKRYSSGMFVRLAFAVAAHLEPEILIIDEVLAVGDKNFQNKCIGKMSEVASDGRTILFVSHNMSMIRKFCDFGIVMNKGQSSSKLPIKDALLLNDSHLNDLEDFKWQTILKGETFSNFKINGSEIVSENYLQSGEDIFIEFQYESENQRDSSFIFSFGLREDETSLQVFYTNNDLEKHLINLNKNGKISAKLFMPYLSPGSYSLEFQVKRNGKIALPNRKICNLIIEPSNIFKSNETFTSFPSLLLVPSEWNDA